MSYNPLPYAATVSVSVASVMSAIQLGWLALPVGILYFFITRYCLNLMSGKTREDDPYKKQAEQVAMLGMVIFLPLIFTLGITSALLVFVVFAQLALNLQTFTKHQYYLGLVLSFALITFSASESRSAGFIVYFILYCLILCSTLFTLVMPQFRLSASLWLKSSGALLVCTLAVYLLMPRFPALLFGTTPGSDHFYHDKVWLKNAENNVQESHGEPTNTRQLNEALLDELAESGQDQQSINELKEALNHFENAIKGHQEQSDTSDSSSQEGDGYYDEQAENQNFGIDVQSRLNNDIVMYVRSDYPLYLTTEMFDQFDGLRWSRTHDVQTFIEPKKGEFITGLKLGNIELGYEVEIASELTNEIPLAWQPSALNFPASALTQHAFDTFQAPQSLKEGTAYQASMKANWHQGRLAYPAKESNLYSYLTLPNQFDGNIAQLAQSVTELGADEWQKANLLEAHLRENYSYTLDTAITSQDVTDLSEFLFETRYGHCEFFASAMALMLRTLGIPSRVVNGYAATDQNPMTGYIEVRGTDKHAWTEAYFLNVGWVPFDPTSYYQLPKEQQEQELTYEKVNEYVDRQLEILENQNADYSFSQLMLQAWQSMSVLFSMLLVLIKWIVVNAGLYIVAGIVCVMIVVMLYKQIKPALKVYFLKRSVQRYKLTHTAADYGFYIQAIRNAFILQGLDAQFSTITDFITYLSRYGLIKDQFQQMQFIDHFDEVMYSDQTIDIEADNINWLKNLFEQVWQIHSTQTASVAPLS